MSETGSLVTADRWGRRSHVVLFLLVFAVGTWLRVADYAAPGLWIDEYGTWWVIAGQSLGDLWERATEVQGQSPFYYLLLRATTSLFGLETATLRGFSLVFGIGLLLLGYALGREIFRDHRVALMAMAALALHERLIFYSQEARPYALALFCAAASFLLYLRVVRGGGRGIWIAYVAVTTATWYSHYLFGILLLIQLLHLLAQRDLTARWRVWLGVGLALGILMAPGLFQLAEIFGRRHSLDWIQDPAEGAAMLKLMVNYLDPIPLAAAAVAVGVLVNTGGKLRGGASGGYPGLATLWFVVPFAICAFLPPLFDVTLANHRYVLIAAPAAMLLVGRVLALMNRGLPWDLVPLLIFAVLMAATVLLPARTGAGVYCYRFNHRWDQAAGALAAEYREGDRVLYASDFVEMDLLVRGEADELTRGFAEWPMRAHLPPEVSIPLYPLPYRWNGATLPAIREILNESAQASRLWIVGTPRTVNEVLDLASRYPQMRIVSDRRFGGRLDIDAGGIRLVLLARS